jgi:hypothetical protein
MLPDPDNEAARAELHQSIMVSPMTVMRLAAAAVGSIYKEVADEHRSGACPCGWQPNPGADVEALQAALAATTKTIPLSDLRVVQVVGRA